MQKAFNFKTVRLGWLITVEFLKRNKLLFFLSFIIILILLFAQLKFKIFYNSNQISLGFIGTYQEHDLPEEVTKLISQSLVKIDENGRSVSNLSSGWETNNDATSFKFKLKDDLKWVDGTKLKSEDLVLSVANTEVKLLDEKTFQFDLKESYSPLPSLLTKPIIKKGSMIGTGPYKITKIEKSRIFITKIELKSNDSSLPTIYIRFYPNEKVALTGFNLGEVQALFGLSNPKTFADNPKVNIKRKTDYSKIVSILFNTKDPALSSRSLRQALAFAAPIIEGEVLANNPYPATLWAYNPDSKKYLENTEEAEAALGRAKVSVSEEKLKEELILTTTPNLEEVGQNVVKKWKNLGLNAKLRIESGIAQNFQSLLITQSIPSDPDQYVLWHTTQEKTNLTKYDSKRVDKDLEDGRKAVDESDRKEKYFDFQKTLLEDAPAIFLYFPKYNIAYLKKAEKNLNKILKLDSSD